MFNSLLSKLGIYNAPELFKELISDIDKNHTLLDLGANVGFYSRIMAKTKAQVHAYEPNPYAFSKLHKNLNRKKNIHLFQKAVSNRNTKMKLFLHENHKENPIKWSTGSSLDKQKANVTNNYVDVDVVDIGDLLEDRYKIIKIDVEGHEIEILNRIFELKLTNRFEHMFVEMHDHKMKHLKKKSDQIRDYIKKNNIKNIHLDWH